MSSYDRRQLIKYIRRDMLALYQGINTYYPYLKNLLELIRVEKPIFSTDFYGFSVFIRKYCFQNYSKEGMEEQLERIKLVESIFFPNNQINYYNEYIKLPFNESSHEIPDPHRLLIFLYITIFERMILNPRNIKDLFYKLLSEWTDAFSKSKMKISIMVYLPIYHEFGEYKVIENVSIYSSIPHIKIDDTEYNEPLIINYGTYTTRYQKVPRAPDKMKCYFRYNVEIPFWKVETSFDIWDKERSILRNCNDYINKKVREFFITLNLFGIESKYNGYVVKYPWWFEFNTDEFDKFTYELEDYEGFSKPDIKSFIQLYKKVVASGIFLAEEFEIITYRYHQINNRNFLPDIILDATIILEFLFTRTKRNDSISSKLSRNCALFISESSQELVNYTELLKKIYELRNKIAHGGNWEKKVESLINENVFSNKDAIVRMIRMIMTRIFKRLLLLKKNHHDILENLKDPCFFEEISKSNDV